MDAGAHFNTADEKRLSIQLKPEIPCLDELHTYRGVRGLMSHFWKGVCEKILSAIICSASAPRDFASEGRLKNSKKKCRVASQIFGTPVKSENIIGGV
jgi:hypothetical protein